MDQHTNIGVVPPKAGRVAQEELHMHQGVVPPREGSAIQEEEDVWSCPLEAVV